MPPQWHLKLWTSLNIHVRLSTWRGQPSHTFGVVKLSGFHPTRRMNSLPKAAFRVAYIKESRNIRQTTSNNYVSWGRKEACVKSTDRSYSINQRLLMWNRLKLQNPYIRHFKASDPIVALSKVFLQRSVFAKWHKRVKPHRCRKIMRDLYCIVVTLR